MEGSKRKLFRERLVRPVTPNRWELVPPTRLERWHPHHCPVSGIKFDGAYGRSLECSCSLAIHPSTRDFFFLPSRSDSRVENVHGSEKNTAVLTCVDGLLPAAVVYFAMSTKRPIRTMLRSAGNKTEATTVCTCCRSPCPAALSWCYRAKRVFLLGLSAWR